MPPFPAPLSTRRLDAAARGSPPPVPSMAIRRTRLEQLLDAHPDRHVVLVRGPVGSGKTTLVSQWVRTQAEPCAWLALDVSHDDPDLLLGQLVDTLERLSPDPSGAVAVRSTPGDLDHTALWDLAELVARQLGTRITLVLDGIEHLHDRAARHVLGVLVENPVEALRLVLVSRAKPVFGLERARLRGDLVEIPPNLLRFARSEIDALLAGDEARRADAADLEQETLGWAAGLRLAQMDALAAQKPSPALGEPEDPASEYVREELIDSAPDEVRAFLEVTCWLPVLTTPLCAAVVGQIGRGPRSARLDLDALPILPIASRPGAFRYPPILSRALQQEHTRRDPHAVAHARRRAAQACRTAGEPVTAVQLYLQAGSTDEAADVCAELAAGGEPALRPVDPLLRDLPGIAPGGGRLLPWRVRAAVAAGRADEAHRLLEQADRARPPGRRSALLEGRDLVIARAIVAEHLGDVTTLLACAQMWLPGPAPDVRTAHQDVDLRADGWRIRALAWSGDVAGARDAVRATDRGSDVAPTDPGGDVFLGRAWVSWLDGDVLDVVELAARRRGATDAAPARAAELALLRGAAHRERNQLTEAAQALVEARSVAASASHHVVAALAASELARCRRAAGATMEALELVVSARSTRDHLPATVDAHLRTSEGRIRLDRGDMAGVGAVLRGAPPSVEMQILTTRLALHESPHHARELLEAIGARTPRQAVEMLLLRALLPDTDQDEVAATLVEAIATGAPLGLVRTFLDEGPAMNHRLQQLAQASPERALGRLAALASQELTLTPSRVTTGPIEQLTTRELAVLRMLPLRMSNREMAAQLYISVNTLKTHIRAIYRKLEVPHRSAAVARARALQLV
ncbi:MAG TPA: LuxR C-terminal-related transcriptional regulator [Acidimicrobiales bacterium]|nr:LuxR C-terminal-related transcriptional regulator [Acidimicrobiales bacterium]